MAEEVDTEDEPKGPEAPEGQHCRHVSGVAVRALLDLVREIAIDGQVAVADVERIAQAILGAGGPLATIYYQQTRTCEDVFNRIAIERQRRDPLGRMVVHPIAALLDTPAGIERKRLPQFLSAVRMMIGEEAHEQLRQRAKALAAAHRGDDGMVAWDALHEAPEAGLILEQVLVLISKSFTRFDARRDWFLVVLNANPSAVSTGSTSFVALKAEERAKFAFTEGHMGRVFDALYASLKLDTFASDRIRAFSRRWNLAPDKLLGPFFVEIARLLQKSG
ncbi:hypothetical protein [Magnetospirillum moscoviense]|uniref:Uncharacterized protein n=1 Tax=Magnetospirillum moscoviense TaxID=1437059 RepID=A0A178MKX4_9PROT|nr:hypothetical protein [Magnetospirillum moscoviense]OAN48654.1 hypothetical protein A6A05_14990 [Magnetospirillum moscoviense]